MAVRPFLVKGRDRIYQAPQLFVRFKEVRRATGRTFAGMQEVESAGWDRSKITIRPIGVGELGDADRIYVCSAGGSTSSAVTAGPINPISNQVKKCVRRITDEDAQIIAVIDDRIAELEAQIRTQRLIRKEAVSSAWQRGKEIPVWELVPDKDEVSRKVTA